MGLMGLIQTDNCSHSGKGRKTQAQPPLWRRKRHENYYNSGKGTKIQALLSLGQRQTQELLTLWQRKDIGTTAMWQSKTDRHYCSCGKKSKPEQLSYFELRNKGQMPQHHPHLLISYKMSYKFFMDSKCVGVIKRLYGYYSLTLR